MKNTHVEEEVSRKKNHLMLCFSKNEEKKRYSKKPYQVSFFNLSIEYDWKK